jgi:hypothetical protein
VLHATHFVIMTQFCAVFMNASDFSGKTVLDVGAGSGMYGHAPLPLALALALPLPLPLPLHQYEQFCI